MKYTLLLLPAFLFAFVAVDNEGNHRITGVIQTIYNYNINSKENNFSPGKIAFGFDGKINSCFGYRMLVSLNPSSFTFSAFDLYGKIFTPLGEVRIGQFKVPFAMERLIPFPMRDFVKNSLVTGMVQSRDFGIALYGKKNKLVEYNFAIINGEGLNKSEANKAKDIVSRIVFKVSDKVRFGGAVYIGKTGPDSSLAKKERYNLQFELKNKWGTLRSEGVKFFNGDQEGSVFYISGGYSIKMEELLQYIEPVVRFEYYDPDNSVEGNELKRYILGINLYFHGYNMRIQLDYLRDVQQGKKQDFLLCGTQFMF